MSTVAELLEELEAGLDLCEVKADLIGVRRHIREAKATLSKLSAKVLAGGSMVALVSVAKVVADEDGPHLQWTIEGGIHDLPLGEVLLVADRIVTDDEGCGILFAFPQEAK